MTTSGAKRPLIKELVDALIIEFRTDKGSGRRESARREMLACLTKPNPRGGAFGAKNRSGRIRA